MGDWDLKARSPAPGGITKVSGDRLRPAGAFPAWRFPRAMGVPGDGFSRRCRFPGGMLRYGIPSSGALTRSLLSGPHRPA